MLPKKRTLVPLFVILMVVLQLMLPALARADEAAPPTDPGVEVVVDPPVETAPTVPEILEQAPEGTVIVVLNEDGSVEPLATQAAAEALATSDPVWCQDGYTPGDDPTGGTYCTAPYADFTSLLADGFIGGTGTIYIENGAYTPVVPETLNGITINGTALGLGALTLQGGWDFTSNSHTAGNTSNFGIPIWILNGASNVRVNDVTIDLGLYVPDSYGLHIDTTGNIDLSNVDVTGAGYDGAYLDNCYLVDIDPGPDEDWQCSTTNDVTVTGSTFDANSNFGLYVDSAGTINLTTVSADGNAYGADLSASDAISISGTSTFNDNDFYGLWAGTDSGNVSLAGVDASGNQYGAIVGTDDGDINILNSNFGYNNTLLPEEDGLGIGLQAATWVGNVTLTNVIATGNDIGASVGSGDGTISIITGSYNDNTFLGLEAGTIQGTITLTDVVANNTLAGPDQDIGVYLGNLEGSIVITGGQFDGNSSKGLYILSTGFASADPDVLLSGVEAVDNGWKGAYIEYYAPCGTTTGGVDVDVDGGTYMTNGGFGIYAAVGPDGTLTTVTAPTLGDNGGATGTSMYDIVVDNSVQPCPPPEEPKGESKPYHEVEVPGTGGEPVEQNCTDYSGTVLILPGEDKATLNCPATGSLNLVSLLQEALPGSIPQGTGFLSAFQFILMDGDQPVTLLPNGGTLNLAFKLPEDSSPNDHYAILYWDPTAKDGAGGWVELPRFMARFDGSPLAFALHPDAEPADGLRILSGARTLGGYVKATVNFTGVFVLIKK